MEFLGWLITLLDAKMPEPQMFGWFHLLFIGLIAVATVILCKSFKNPSEQTVRKIVFYISLLSIVLEIYKQFNYTFSYNDGVVTADYQWYAFPFQFCSTPMIVGFISYFIKNKKVYNAILAYLATFAMFAGLCVLAYPPQVFIETIGINIQTMICHGTMIMLGIYLFYCGAVKAKIKTILPATTVFSVLIFIAIILNEIAYFSGLLERENFNMFYISPHCEPSLPVYSLVQQVVPYPLSLVIYIAGFSAAALIILLVAMPFTAKRRVKEN